MQNRRLQASSFKAFNFKITFSRNYGPFHSLNGKEKKTIFFFLTLKPDEVITSMFNVFFRLSLNAYLNGYE